MDTAILRAPPTHPPVFQDGLGTRYHVPGPGGETLEVLALPESLAAAPSFEFSLRERAGALAAFAHPAFMRIRGVQRLGQAGAPAARSERGGVEETAALAIVSDCPAGARLSEVLAVAGQQLLPLDIDAALHLIRQLVHAVAALHEQMHGISHGALTPERLVVAPQGRLLVADHALGAALERLHFNHEKYWKDLGIPLPNPAGTPRFDQRADILQVGAVALALSVGRSLHREEFPDRIRPLAERAWGLTAASGVEPLRAAVRAWLARALQLDARQSFASAVDARAELDRIVAADQGAAFAADQGAAFAADQGAAFAADQGAAFAADQGAAFAADQGAALDKVRAWLAQHATHAASAPAQADLPPRVSVDLRRR
jgi:hypothetical protein